MVCLGPLKLPSMDKSVYVMYMWRWGSRSVVTRSNWNQCPKILIIISGWNYELPSQKINWICLINPTLWRAPHNYHELKWESFSWKGEPSHDPHQQPLASWKPWVWLRPPPSQEPYQHLLELPPKSSAPPALQALALGAGAANARAHAWHHSPYHSRRGPKPTALPTQGHKLYVDVG